MVMYVFLTSGTEIQSAGIDFVALLRVFRMCVWHAFHERQIPVKLSAQGYPSSTRPTLSGLREEPGRTTILL